MSDRGKIMTALKADIVQSIGLYFAPIMAVWRAFHQAVGDHTAYYEGYAQGRGTNGAGLSRRPHPSRWNED